MNEAAAQTPARVSQQIYTASQQGDPTTFLLWHATSRITKDQDPGRISLLHSVRYYASRMRRPSCKWDDGTFANRGDFSYGTAPLAVWYPTYLHLDPAVYMPIVAAIDTSISDNTNITLLRTYGAGDAGIEIIRCCKTVYVPAPYVGLLLCAEISPAEAWNRLHGEIVDAAAKNSCQPLIDWLRAAIVRSGPNTHSALVVTSSF